MQIGTLTLEMAANVARIQQDMAQARRVVDDATGHMRRAAESAASALAAVGVGLSVAGLSGWIKGAIDAADEMSKLSQKAGLAAQEVAGLKLAFDQAGAGDKFGASMAKLAKEVAAGNDQLAALGVRTKKTDGSLRASRDVLADVADKFAAYRDGAEKVAAAQAIFGKSGADLIPLLNGGAAALAEYDQKARDLGLTLTDETQKAAEQFNDQLDLISQRTQGMARQVATELLPTLNALTEAYSENAAGGDSLASMLGGVLKTALQTIAVLANNVVYVFRATKGEIETWVEQLKALASFDFSKFGAIGDAWKQRAQDMRAEVDALDQKIQGLKLNNKGRGDGGFQDPRIIGMPGSIREQTEAWKASIPVAKAAGRAAREAADPAAKFLEKLQKERDALGLGATAAKVYEAQLAGLTGKTLEQVKALAREIAAYKAAEEVAKERQKLRADELKGIEEHMRALDASASASLKSVNDRLQSLQDEQAAVDLTYTANISLAEAIERVAIARLQEKQAGFYEGSDGWQNIQREIEAREKLLGHVAAKDAREQWLKVTEDINRSLTDALMRGFESGKGFARNLRDTLKNLFQTLVLRPLIQPVVGGITGLLGLAGPAAAGQGGMGSMGQLGSMLTGGSSLLSIGSQMWAGTMSGANAAGTLGANAMGTGLDGLLASNGAFGTAGGSAAGLGGAATAMGGALVGFMAGKMISGGYSAIGKSGNTAVAAGTAAGAVIGSVLPGLGTAIGAVAGGVIGGTLNRAFGMGAKKVAGSGITGSFGAQGADVQAYTDWKQKGGWFRSDKSGRETSAISSELDRFLDESTTATAAAVRNIAQALGLSADAVAGYTQTINVSLKDLDAAGQEKAIAEALAAFGDGMAEQVIPGLKAMQKVGESYGQAALRAARQVEAVRLVTQRMGVGMELAGQQGAMSADKLVGAFGDLDQFAAKTAAYYQAFYSEGERAARAQREMTDALAGVNLTLPASRTEFRALAESLLKAGAGSEQAFAALMNLAPAFEETQAALDRLAADTAAKLIATFTANGQLVPVLGNMQGALAQATQQAQGFTGPVQTIHRVLGDASSGTLTFGDRLRVVTTELTPAQAAVAQLRGQVFDLRTAAGGAVVDVSRLSAALNGVDDATFVATVVGLFERIGQRVKDVLSGIADERASLRDAAIGIIGPSALSAAQIRRQIADSLVGMPSNAAVAAAQKALADAGAQVAASEARKTAASVALDAARKAQAATISATSSRVKAAEDGVIAWFNKSADVRRLVDGNSARLLDGSIAPGTTVTAKFGAYGGTEALTQSVSQALTNLLDARKAQADQVAAAAAKVANAEAALSISAAAAKAAIAAQTAAVNAAKVAQIDYIKSLQQYSLDASRAVTNLSRLREETVKYYESQKQLADLMTGTAASLRATVAGVRFDMLDPRAQLNQLQERFNVAYSMALSTTGQTLAQYGQELNSLINPLLQKAQEAGIGGSAYSALVNTVLARAEAAASRLDANAPKDYQAESLGLLGQIDSTLAALEKGALTADQLIVQAINAGRDVTRDGLRAVVAALTGQAVPAFAAGGLHTGGVRLVGERGPELEVTGPARIFTADQTARMLRGGGGTDAALVQELQALRAEVAALRREQQAVGVAVATNTGRAARKLERWDVDGAPVRNADGQPLVTEAA